MDARWQVAKAVAGRRTRKSSDRSLTTSATDAAVTTDPDRRAAEWVLSIGGKISIKENGQERPIGAVGDLPRGAFELTVVTLDDNPKVTDAGLAHFKDCKNLTYLNLTWVQVTGAGLVHFQDCQNLTSLNLMQFPLGDAGLAHFKDCKNLTYLGLNGIKMTDAGLAHFQDCKNITTLGLDNNQVTDAGLARFHDCQNLTHLSLSDTQVSDAGLAGLASLPRGRLLLDNTRISLQGYEQLKLALPKCEITWSETNRTVAECVLALGGTVEIGTPGQAESRPIQSAADLPRDYFQVRRVSLAAVAQPLGELPTSLSRLRFPEFDRLESLDLSGSTLPNYDLLAPIHGLRELILANAGLNDESLAKLPKLPALKRLVLDGNEIRGPGLTSLKEQPELLDLSLGCPTLSDLLAKNLAELKQIKRLSLAGSGLSDAGIKHLAGLTNLESLDLRRTKATAAGIAELQTAFPNCQIVWDDTAMK